MDHTLRAHATREEGIRLADAANRAGAAFVVDGFGGQGPIADLEILCADLSRILYEETHPHRSTCSGMRPHGFPTRGRVAEHTRRVLAAVRGAE
ncbi:hypothetical protein [Streptomyces sp. NPDC001568]|uniref:hypothetical protein n=1 Tax=Streptomyces sp. NPDC001568 TaxID=3364588 RepID=UPI0036CE0970